MSFYRAGAASVANGSTAVTGTGVTWNVPANARPGDAIVFDADGRLREIAAIPSATTITLVSAYTGPAITNGGYQIVPLEMSRLSDAADILSGISQSYATVRDTVGQGLFPDGSAAAPGVRFAADQDTGVRRAGANDARGVANGADVFGWSAGVLNVYAPTVNVPAGGLGLMGGGLGIGVAPAAWPSFYRSLDVSTFASFYGATTNIAGLSNNATFNGTNWVYRNNAAASNYYQSGGEHVWQVAPSQPAGTVVSWLRATTVDINGNLLVGATTTSGLFNGASVNVGTVIERTGSITNQTNAGPNVWLSKATGYTNGVFNAFAVAGSTVGTISTNGTTTAYNTSSDRRLKTNIADAGDAGAVIDAIRVRRFDWRADGSHTPFGFVAQELAEVAPDAVTAGDDGAAIAEVWGVDPSKLVPLLVRELQALRARVAALEAG